MGQYYQLTLALKADKHRNAVNLEKLEGDLCCARDEFNELRAGCILVPLKPGMRRLNLLLKSESSLTMDNVATRLQHFFRILAEEYDWSPYSSDDGELFTVKILKPTDPETCQALLRESRKKSPALFTSYESKLFFGENILATKDDTPGQDNPFRRHLKTDEYMDKQPALSLAEACSQLDKLVGLDSAKKEIKMAMRLVEHVNKHNSDPQKSAVFPYHYFITADKSGVGMTTLLELMAVIFYHLGVYKRYDFEEHTVKEDEHFHIYRRDEDGLLAIHNIDILEKENPRDFAEVTEQIKKNTGDALCVLTITGKSTDLIEQTRKKLEQHINLRSFHIPDYSTDQLVQIGEKMLACFGMTLEEKARQALKSFLSNAAVLDELENARSVKKIMENLCFAKIEKMVEGEDEETATITSQEVEALAAALSSKEIDAGINADTFAEMNTIIGLAEVKEKVVETCRAIALNKKKAELGIIEKRPSLHMLFTGNPGTGKTTMARIIAAILKEMEVLSKGGFYELTRDDLISVYLGGTANKTRRKIQEAYGSVLFIDEAYSLDGGHEHDYGHEALATLVKEMEDKRDDLVVILAGYTGEMEKMLAINPGLKNRIAHQVGFPDYTAPELLQILKRELGDGYNLEEGSSDVLLELFAEAVRRADRYFGNGRFARTVAERLLAKQALRLGEQDLNSREILQSILLEDVKAVAQDKDIAPWCKESSSKKGIGF